MYRVANVFFPLVLVGFGIFCVLCPERAINLKKRDRHKFDDLPAASRPWFLWSYRAFGLVMTTGGVVLLLKVLGIITL